MRYQRYIDRDLPVHKVITFGKVHPFHHPSGKQQKSKTKTITNIFGLTLIAGPGKPKPRLYDPTDLKNIDKRISFNNSSFEQGKENGGFCNHIDYSQIREKGNAEELGESIEQSENEAEKNEESATNRDTLKEASDHEDVAVMTLSSCFQTEANTNCKVNI